jgi:hypothetical protein
MALIDGTQLGALQTRMLDALIDTCTVSRTTAPVNSPRGGRLAGGTSAVYTGACLVETAQPATVAVLGGGLTAVNTHRIKFPVGANVASGDVVVGSRRFTVQGIASGSFGLLEVATALEVGNA